MQKTLLGIGVTTIVVFIWGFIYWGLSTIPYSSWKQTTDDVKVQQFVREHLPESGTYFIPGNQHDPETLAGLYESGPVGFIHINLEGRPQVDPSIMAGGFVLNLIAVCAMAMMFNIAGATEFRDFARLSLITGAVAVILIHGGDIIWWMAPVSWKVWQIIYDFSFWLIAGHLLGIFMKRSNEPVAE